MDLGDPTTNPISFTLGPADEFFTEPVGARDEDGFRRAWRRIVAEHGADAGRVTRIAAYWEPSAADREFLDTTFADAGLQFLFERPEPAGWDSALEKAQQVLDEVLRAEEAGELAEEARRAREKQANGELLPVLRSGSLGGSDVVRQTMPWLPVAGRDLFATFAYTALTPRGTVGMRHVLNDHLDGAGGFTEVVTTALASVRSGLVLEEAVTETGRLLRVHRPDGFGAAGAVMLPDFHERMSGIHGWDELTVAILCPDEAWITQSGTPDAERLAREVRAAGQQAPELRPALLTVTATAIDLVTEGGS
ncbi:MULTISPECIES: hypothetical protein [Amycolatopsis]|uniref:Uncharacterized protein n=1 Tax=Amycolatopsis thermalba TaxID=944492 RepID=A0ABY4NY96_9PSEU|nr:MULTISPECIES: hypothetical protein [Amycolatopsis]OXM74765.1 hypothetical protein CF166_01855 [Amycolatopsis sp. KNN50.9b]UQS25057.1 hypothetical protein L1857_20685 [Amycolatopsis thermalba]